MDPRETPPFADARPYAPVTLLVDDDDFMLDVLSEHMTRIGASQIHCAGNGRIALRMLETMQRPPDLIICDVFMPDMDGIEFLDHLATRRYGGDVIVVSGGDAQMLTLSELIGSTGGLRVLASMTKPVSLEELTKVLHASARPAA